jgi:tRNA (guanine-N(7)-)-methyltransferase
VKRGREYTSPVSDSEHPPSPDRRASWRAPESAPTPAADAQGVRGALGGSRLFDQPRYRAEAEAFLAFLAPSGPVAVEIGFDHGMRLLELARTQPEVRWLGLEVREARVLAVAPHCPPNCHVWRADARTVFRGWMPAGRLSRVDVLFPTPWWDEGKRDKRLLLTPAFVADLARALAPSGVFHLATDVGPYFEHVEGLFATWRRVADPSPVGVLSRRERVCRRDALPVWRGTWSPG